MKLREAIIKFDKSSIKAGDGNKNGSFPLYTCSPVVNKFLDSYIYDDEAIILSTGGNFSVHYVNGKFNTSTDCLTFKTNRFNNKYLYYYILSKSKEIQGMFRGAGLKHLNKNEFLQLNIDGKLLDEQFEIVRKLDLIQAMLDIKKEQLQSYDALIKSQFVEMFGDMFYDKSKYNIVKLESIATVSSSHRVFTTEFVEKGIPFYRGTEIGQLANGIIPEKTYYISEEHYKKICDDNTKPKIGDLLMPSICDKGQIWMVNTKEPFYYKDGRVLSISLKESNMNYIYFHQYMKFKTQIEFPKIGSGATFAEFKIFLLKNLDVIIPPLELQNQFAKIVEHIDKSKADCKKTIDGLEKLLEISMNECFN